MIDRRLRAGAAVALLALAAASFGADWTSFLSPGALQQGHAAFAGDCDQCHLVFSGVPDAKCLRCHEPIAVRLSELRGFHAKHRESCMSCHPDHRGASFVGTTPEALAAFDHAETGFALGGAHRPLACDRCHTGPLETLTDDPSGRVGCVDCHEDPHESARGPDCGPCHSDAGWNVGLKTLEEHRTPMDGGHDGLACDDCHRHGENLDPVVPCSNCHTQAHGGTASDCAQCHEVAGFTPAKFDHGPCTCAFPGKHQTVACLECHAEFDFTDTPTLCAGCHEQDRKHEPLGECARCHNATSWSDSQFDHDRASFVLRDRHLAVSCTQCHPAAGVFRDAPSDCASCHQAAGDRAHGDFGPCERCHVTAGFAPSTFDHASIGFPLTGRHAATKCQDCHAVKVQGYPTAPQP
ncbi:MAG: hypothetical protein R3F59_30355 [Myxococcota bacterium]